MPEAGIDKASLMQTIANGARELTNVDAAAVEICEGDKMVYASVSGTDHHVDQAACRKLGCRAMVVVPLKTGSNISKWPGPDSVD